MSDIQRDREERQHVIKVLQNMVDWMEAINYIVATPERRHALEYAIASIKTDLKYDLLYEETSGQADKPTTKNNLGVDYISRKAVLDAIDSKAWEFCDYLISKGRNDEQKPVSHFADNLRECVREEMTSVTPQEQITDLKVDCISRRAVIEEMEKRHTEGDYITKGFINSLPSVTPIRPKGRWIVQPSNKEQGERDFIWWKCSECGQVIFSETEKDRKEFHAFCGRCGADMREVVEE